MAVATFVNTIGTVVHGFWQFLGVAVVENLVASSNRAARGAMFAVVGCAMPLAVRIRPPALLATAEAGAPLGVSPGAVADVPAV